MCTAPGRLVFDGTASVGTRNASSPKTMAARFLFVFLVGGTPMSFNSGLFDTSLRFVC